VRIDGSLYFGAVNHAQDRLQEMRAANPEQKHLLIVASGINFIDMAGAEFLAKLAEEKEAAGGRLYLYDIKEGICSHFKLTGYLLDIGTDYIYESKTEAIAEIFTHLDPEICKHCTARIFMECKTVPGPF
jgi:sulfate permease, SulP family